MGKEKKAKIAKPVVDKTSKSQISKKRKNGGKKKSDEYRKYGYISTSSVVSIAESAGFSGLQDEVARNLAEDVSYRLRSIVQNCSKYMKHTRHKKLTCRDVDEVLKFCDVPPLYGYADNPALGKFTYVREADVFVIEDTPVDLAGYALSEILVHQKQPYVVEGSWQVPNDSKPKGSELKQKGDDQQGRSTSADTSSLCHSSKAALKMNHIANNHTQSKQDGNTTGRKLENHKLAANESEDETKIATSLIKYYSVTCNTILGHSDLKIVFQDLTENRKILPIIPFLLNFITITLNKLSSERQIRRLLQTVNALTANTSIDFTPYQPTSRVVSAILMIIAIDKKSAKVSYDCGTRRYAAEVLSKVFARWCCRDEQKAAVVKKMGELLYDVKVSSKVHYGAIVLLTVLGAEALNSFWTILDQYLPYLELVKAELGHKVMKDVAMLEDAILSASRVLYRFPHVQGMKQRPDFNTLDSCLYEYFGDSLCVVRRNLLEDPRYLASCSQSQSILQQDSSKAVERTAKRLLKYMSTRYKAETHRPTIDTVFELPEIRKKRNPRIIFKLRGIIPVPEIGLKRKRLDSRYSQFIAGKESEGHVVVVGRFWRRSRFQDCGSPRFGTDSIFSVL